MCKFVDLILLLLLLLLLDCSLSQFLDNKLNSDSNQLSLMKKPIFINKSPEKLYATSKEPVVIRCAVKYATELMINCINDKEIMAKTSTALMLDNSQETLSLKEKNRKKKQPTASLIQQNPNNIETNNIFDEVNRRSQLKMLPNKIMQPRSIFNKLSKPMDFGINEQEKPEDKVSKSVRGYLHQVNLTLTDKTIEIWFVNKFWCQCEARYTENTNFPGPQINSSKTFIDVAYLTPKFQKEPNSASLYIRRYVKLTCIGPEGNPKPTIKWLKDGSPLEIIDEKRVFVSEDGSLVIQSTQESDSGEYQCIASNVAGTYTSRKAQLEVLAGTDTEEGWLSWSPWNLCPSECKYGVYCAQKCRKYIRKRSRDCRSSAELRTKCTGVSIENESCAKMCRVDGIWGEWSQWSLCQPDCTRKRIRECNNPAPRAGGSPCAPRDGYMERENCTSNLCRNMLHNGDDLKLKNSQNDIGVSVRDMIVYIVLSIALFLLILIATFVLCVQKRQLLFNTNTNSYDGKVFSSKNAFILMKKMDDKECVMKDSNTDSFTTYSTRDKGIRDPHTVSSLTHPLLANNNNNNTINTTILNGTNNNYPPIFTNTVSNHSMSAQSQSSTANQNPLAPPLVNFTVPPNSSLSSPSSSSSKTNNKISCHYKEVGLPNITSNVNRHQPTQPPPVPLQPQPLLPFSPITSPIFIQTGAVAVNPIQSNNNNRCTFDDTDVDKRYSTSQLIVNNMGGKIILGSTGVSVTIMPDSFCKDDNYKIEIYTRNSHEKLIEFTSYTQLSSMIVCNLPDCAKLKRPIIINFPHCLAPCKSGSYLHNWELIIAKMNTTFNWDVFLQLNTEYPVNMTPAPRNYCLLNDISCCLMLHDIYPICLLGQPNPIPPLPPDSWSPDTPLLPSFEAEKRLCVVVFLEPLYPPTNISSILVTCYFFIDTKDIRDQLILKITSAGCRVFDIPKSFFLKNQDESVVLTVESTTSNWKIAPRSKFQEIDHAELWKIKSETYYPRSILLEQASTGNDIFSGNVLIYQNNFYHDKVEVSVQFGSEIRNTNPNPNSSQNLYPICKMIPPSKIFRLPRATIRDLASKLDPPAISGAQWKMIAKQLGITMNLEYFLNQTSPTTYLLQFWEANNREETALVDLKSTLRIMGFIEISNVLN